MQISSTTAPGPTFVGGLQFAGSGGRFSSFSATATDAVVGDAAGYATLPEAVDAITTATIGVREPAAGVFAADGRYYGRQLDNAVTFANGAAWTGMWRLEQHPADLELLGPKTTTTRSEALRAVVDGAQRVDVTHLPVA